MPDGKAFKPRVVRAWYEEEIKTEPGISPVPPQAAPETVLFPQGMLEQPLWRKGLGVAAKGVEVATAPLRWVHEKAIEPFAATVTAPWSPEVPGTEELPWMEKQLAEYKAWKAPWGVKGAIETLPWFAVPTAGTISAGLKGMGLAGRVAAAALKPAVMAEQVPGKVLGLAAKGVRKALAKPVPLELPATADVMQAVQKRVLSPKLLAIPGVRQIVGAVNYALTADDPIKMAKVVIGKYQDTSEAALTLATSKARSINPRIKVKDGMVVDDAIKQIEKLPGEVESRAIHDIVEYAPRYEMPERYRSFIDEIRRVSKEFSKMAIDEDLPIKQLKGEPDFVYLHRVVVSVKEDAAKELAARIESLLAKEGRAIARQPQETSWAYVTRITEDVGKGTLKDSAELRGLLAEAGNLVDVPVIRQRLDKARYYDLVVEGLKGGVKYADDPLVELTNQGKLIYNHVINKRVGEILSPLGIAKSELVKQQIGFTAEQAREELVNANEIKQLIVNVQRGLRPHPQTLKAAIRRYPEIGKQIQEISRLPIEAWDKRVAALTDEVAKLRARLTAEVAAARVASKVELEAKEAALAKAQKQIEELQKHAKQLLDFPDEERLRIGLEAMDDDVRLAFKEALDNRIQTVGQILDESSGNIEGIRAFIESERAAQLVDLMPKAKMAEGELAYITKAMFKKYLGYDPPANVITERTRTEIRPAHISRPKKGKPKFIPEERRQVTQEVVRWEYSLDQIATEYGYESADALRAAIMRVARSKEELRGLERLAAVEDESMKSLQRVKGMIEEIEKPVPIAVAGMPEAGLQPGMFGEEIRVTPKGKGKVTQIDMDDLLKLEEYKTKLVSEGQYAKAVTPELKPAGITPAAKAAPEVIAPTTGKIPLVKPPPPTGVPPPPLGAPKERFNALKTLAKAEISKARSKVNLANRTAQKVVSPETGMVVGIPGLSGKVIQTQTVFGRDIARKIQEQLGWMPEGAFEKTIGKIGTIGGMMRMAKASLDLSVTQIQLLPILGVDFVNFMTSPLYAAGIQKLPIFGMIRKPSAHWAKAVTEELKAFVSPARAEAAYWALPENQFIMGIRAKAGALLQPSEYYEAYGPALRGLAELPVVGKPGEAIFRNLWGRAEAAFTAGRNVGANEYFKGVYDLALKMGKVEEAALGSNLLTGVLSTRGMGIGAAQRNLESGILFFSPRFTRACAATLGHIVWNPTSWTGREAMRAITGLVGASAVLTSMGQLAQGKKPHLNPLPTDVGGDGGKWLTVEVGGRNIGLGGILVDLRLATRIISDAISDPDDLLTPDMSNPVLGRLRAKFAPPTAVFWDYMTGRTWSGEPMRAKDSLLPTKETMFQTLKWGLPIWVEAQINEGVSLHSALAEFFGGRQFPESMWDKYQRRMVQIANVETIDELSPYDRARLEQQNPELQDLKDAAETEMRNRGFDTKQSRYWEVRGEARDTRLKLLEQASDDYAAGKFNAVRFKDIIQETGKALRVKYGEIDAKNADIIADMQAKAVEKQGEWWAKGWTTAVAYRKYWDIILTSVDQYGMPDYETRDIQLDGLRQAVGDEVWAKVEEWNRWERQDYPTEVQNYFADMETIRPYFQIRDEILKPYPELKAIYDELERSDEFRQRAIIRRTPELRRVERLIAIARQRMRRENPDIDRAGVKWYGWSPKNIEVVRELGR